MGKLEDENKAEDVDLLAYRIKELVKSYNGFVEMGSNTTNKIARGMKSWQELHLIYIENQFCTITLLRVAAISQEKKRKKKKKNIFAENPETS